MAWLFVVVGVGGLLKDLWPLVTNASQQLATLRADGAADLVPAWTLRAAAVVGGLAVLRAHNWARWLLVAWMLAHVVISAFHTWQEVLVHVGLFIPLAFALCRPAANAYFAPPASRSPLRSN